jgi:protein-tyrosine phosphatase
MIIASMRQWLQEGGGGVEGEITAVQDAENESLTQANDDGQQIDQGGKDGKPNKNKRVVVVHCKAGKGRSGTMACSYLISECGWTPEDALARFTKRRMRPNFGNGVSIPSQLRWVSYVNRWVKGGKKFVDRPVEIVEIHVWGLRHGVKVSVEGFLDEGKKIHNFHTFTGQERIVIEGDAPGGRGVIDLVSDIAGYGISGAKGDTAKEADHQDAAGDEQSIGNKDTSSSADEDRESTPSRSASRKFKSAKTSLLRNLSKRNVQVKGESKTIVTPASTIDTSSTPLTTTSNGNANGNDASSKPQAATTLANSSEPGGMAVIFKPAETIRLPNSDVNIAVERRNRGPSSMGLTMVTAVAHVWFNTFFEGGGPEKDGQPDNSGVFEIEWDKMDGIKGSSQKGTRAYERLSVVWRYADESNAGKQPEKSTTAASCLPEVEVSQAMEVGDGPVPQMRPANWKGGNDEDPDALKHLGLRVEDPNSANASKASSLKNVDIGDSSQGPEPGDGTGKDNESLRAVKTSGPSGEEILDERKVTDTKA